MALRAVFPIFNHPADQWPAAYTPGLLLALGVWAAVTVLLCFPCRWYEGYKFRNNYWWLKYL